MLPYANKGGTYNYVLICIQTMSVKRYMKLVKVNLGRGAQDLRRSVSRITLVCPVM